MKKNVYGKEHCFIATATFGSEMSEEVVSLKQYRDKVLLHKAGGRAFVKFYYLISPPIAKAISNKPKLRVFVRFLLKPIIFLSNRTQSNMKMKKSLNF
jgi:hypothetical protein